MSKRILWNYFNQNNNNRQNYAIYIFSNANSRIVVCQFTAKSNNCGLNFQSSVLEISSGIVAFPKDTSLCESYRIPNTTVVYRTTAIFNFK